MIDRPNHDADLRAHGGHILILKRDADRREHQGRQHRDEGYVKGPPPIEPGTRNGGNRKVYEQVG